MAFSRCVDTCFPVKADAVLGILMTQLPLSHAVVATGSVAINQPCSATGKLCGINVTINAFFVLS